MYKEDKKTDSTEHQHSYLHNLTVELLEWITHIVLAGLDKIFLKLNLNFHPSSFLDEDVEEEILDDDCAIDKELEYSKQRDNSLSELDGSFSEREGSYLERLKLRQKMRCETLGEIEEHR